MKKIRIVLLSVVMFIFLFTSSSEAGTLPPLIRIGLFFGTTAQSKVSISGSELILSNMAGNFLGKMDGFGGGGTAYTVSPVRGDKGEKFIGIYDTAGHLIHSYEESTDIIIVPAQGFITINGKPYRGGAAFRVNSEMKMNVINVLPLEEYLYGVLPKEMVPSWGEEALKAQAVAARTYAIRNYGRFIKQGFDLCTTQNCQVYGGVAVENPRTTKAVNDTRGLVIYYQGEPIQAVYHSSSGGITEHSENIWHDSIFYLRGVYDQFSLGSPHDSWTYEIGKGELEAKLTAAGKGVGSITGISIDQLSPNGRVLKLSIHGTKGVITYEKERIRRLIGYSNLKSNWFVVGSASIEPPSGDFQTAVFGVEGGHHPLNALVDARHMAASDKFVFVGRGYGHGLGMSQYGAKGMADQGYNFADIIRYYFAGVEIY